MQSNNGVRFDGTTNAPVMSAESTYTCSSSQGHSVSGDRKWRMGKRIGKYESVPGNFPFPLSTSRHLRQPRGLTSDRAGGDRRHVFPLPLECRWVFARLQLQRHG